MDTKILEDIGLSTAEIKVYLALLELGTATAGPILEKAGLQNSVVHMTLNKLIDKGFVTFVKEGKRNHYQAANPRHIIEYMNEKKERFEQILPELLLKQRQSREKPEVITFRGVKGIRELLYELLEAGGENHYTVGSCVKSLMMGEAWWVSYHKKRATRRIRAKLIFNESLRQWCEINRYPKAEYKFTHTNFEPLTETIIRNDKIGIIIWTDKPFGVLLHNKEAADSYTHYFELIWNQAGK